MRLRQILQCRLGPLDQLDRCLYMPAVIGNDTEKMQRFAMFRVLLQRLAVERLRPLDPSRLMMGEAGIHRPSDASGAAGVLFVVL